MSRPPAAALWRTDSRYVLVSRQSWFLGWCSLFSACVSYLETVHDALQRTALSWTCIPSLGWLGIASILRLIQGRCLANFVNSPVCPEWRGFPGCEPHAKTRLFWPSQNDWYPLGGSVSAMPAEKFLLQTLWSQAKAGCPLSSLTPFPTRPLSIYNSFKFLLLWALLLGTPN